MIFDGGVSDFFCLLPSCENERALLCGLLDTVCSMVKYFVFKTFFFM